MTHLIHNNSNIKGISMPGLKDILSQFADDTSAYLSYDKETLNEFCQTLEYVENQIGLKISYEKTKIFRVGSLANSCAKLYTKKTMSWSDEPIDTLGVLLSCTGHEVHTNFTKILDKIRKVCENWFNRTLSLIGKVTVINLLMYSICTYNMITLCNMTNNQLDIIINIIKKFLWGNTKARISMYKLTNSKEQGGLGLYNKQKSLKISWLYKIKNDAFLESSAYNKLHNNLRQLIWRCNLKKKDV